MTCTMIGAWLTELFLHERGEQGSNERAMLAQFLNANVHLMDAKTIMKILTSHDVAAAECASYAAQSGDIKTAVNAALSIGNRDSVCFALRILGLSFASLAVTFSHFSLFAEWGSRRPSHFERSTF